MRNFIVLLSLITAVVAVPTPDTVAKNAATLQAKKRVKNLVPNFSTGRVALWYAIEVQRSKAAKIAQLKTVRINERSASHHVNKRPSELISSLSGAVRTPDKHKALLSKGLRKALFKTPKINRSADDKQDWLTVSRAGLTGDQCTSATDCDGDRRCVDIDAQALCDGGTRCICFPQELIDCTSDADCPTGEGCTNQNSGGAVCVSIAAGGGGGGSGGSTSAPTTTAQNTTGGTSGGSGGLTGDKCTSATDCDGDRRCVDIDAQALCDGGTGCICFPQELIDCTSDADCPTGEGCTNQNSGGAVCVSIAAGGGGGGSGGSTSAPTTTAQSTTGGTSGGSGGLTGDKCTSATDCDGDRRCVDIDAQALCDGGTGCICFPQELIDCTSDADCPTGEGCTNQNSGGAVCVSIAAGGGGGGSGGSGSTSAPTTTAQGTTETTGGGEGTTTAPPTGAPSTTDSGGSTTAPTTTAATGGGGQSGSGNTNEPVCVDARALSHLSQDELVFKQHTMANVLCDGNESCATAGHIVAYKGTAMMMSSYCAIVGCTKQRMLVNSPSYRRGMRVASKTKDLDFTAFAARYNTRAEEVFLTAAVHIGL